ncbi:MAG: serine hydrolase domain-containing protein [Chlamydiales bacterium]
MSKNMKKTNTIQQGGLSQDRLHRLSRTLQGYVDRNEIAGIVALIHRRGEEAYVESIGWQDKEAQLPIQRNTLFRIASMTKPITTVAALTLVEEGKIRLFDPIDIWLPELANRMVMRDPMGSPDDVFPSPRPITLHDLLTYRLGIGWGKSSLRQRLLALTPSTIADVLQIQDVERLAPDAWMARLGEFPLLNKPGEHWRYQVASEILGVLITRVTGKPLEAFLRECLFEPLGMMDTSFVVPAKKRSRLATLYAQTPKGGLVVRDHPENTLWAEPPLFPSAGGGLVSTVDDFQRFGRMMLNNGELEGIRILSRKTVEAMTTDYLTPEQHTHITSELDRYDMDRSAGPWDNWGFGYGVAVRTKRIGLGPSVGSFYWPGAFGTTWIADPQEGLVATLLIQVLGANPFYTQVGEDFLTLTYQSISD